MQSILALVFVGLVAAVPTRLAPTVEAQFESWKLLNGKVYESDEEHARRLSIFTANAAIIEKHNSEGHSWQMGFTKFADMTPNEFESLQTLMPSTLGTEQSSAPLRYVASGNALPDSVDWREHGLVNPVKDQGQCGSCWAFSTIVSYEGQAANKSGSLASFSEQNLVDCVKDITAGGEKCCDGCEGGLMDSAFAYMIQSQAGKVDSESSYPYRAVDEGCKFSGKSVGAVPVLNYTDVAKGDENDLKDAVANVGPISVAVDANLFWQLYTGGVFTPAYCNKKTLNHGVAVVGYGSADGKDYWIIRNSWGKVWGEQGYMRMHRGSNVCGVANSAVFPNV